jgi:uncharacterized membrane protein
MKRTIPFDLILAATLSIICSAIIWMGIDLPLVKVTAGLCLALILPGYTFAAALFPGHSLDLAARAMIIPGASIMVAAAAGLGLYSAGWNLSAQPISLTLCIFVVAASAIAILRRQRTSFENSTHVLPPLRAGQGLMLLAALALCGGALYLSSRPVINPANLQGYAVLWILPTAKDTPNDVRIGIINNQFTPAEYRLRITVGDKFSEIWPDIKLGPGQNLETTYRIPSTLPPNATVTAFLYQPDHPETVYRQVSLIR